MQRVIVCGGRNYDDAERLARILEYNVRCDDIVITGNANGADSLAANWCANRGIDFCVVPAMWSMYGDKAGPIRNLAMLKLNPDLVIAFPGGSGTKNMIEKAGERGVGVLEVISE